MNRPRAFLLSSLAVAVVAIGSVPYVSQAADKPGGGKGGAPAAPVDAPTVTTSLFQMMDGFKWGVTHAEVIDQYNKIGGIFDRDYDPLLRKAQPGVQMRALEAQRDNQKAALERTFIQFGDVPTGMDATPQRSEYSYRNHESALVADRGGKTRYFYFMGTLPGERLWKIYDEIPLDETGPLGKTYAEAVTRIQNALGVAARVRAADPSQGIMRTTADWQDSNTHLRMLDRSNEHKVGVVFEERQTLNALAQLRSNKVEDPMALDPSIAAITKGGLSDPNAAAASASAAKPAGKPKKK
jgi:hypothetical protein